MKKKFLVILLLLAGYQIKAQIQTNNFNRFDTDKNTVYVDIQLKMTDFFVNDNEYLVFTPIIQSGDKTFNLLKVLLYGKGRTSSDEESGTNKPYVILNMMNRRDFVYQVDVTYEPWMDESSLKLKRTIYGADGMPTQEFIQTISNRLIQTVNPHNTSNTGAFITSGNTSFPTLNTSSDHQSTAQPIPVTASSTKNNTNENTYELYFDRKESYNITEISNRDVIEKICITIDNMLKENSNARIKIDISAGTCPYGMYDDNENLTKQQAMAFQRYLEGKYSPQNLNINSKWVSEDWPGLVQLIQQDNNMPYKYEMINIINNTGIFTGREKKLMGMAQGMPYGYMKENLFPRLWKIECKISK